jgi:hypothetical protein
LSHSLTIKNQDKIFTACGDGQASFISTSDVAAVAFSALTEGRKHDKKDYILGGPELLTLDQVSYRNLLSFHSFLSFLFFHFFPLLFFPRERLTDFLKIAEKLSSCVGRQISHVKLGEQERTEQLMGFGLPKFRAEYLTALEIGTAKGGEATSNDNVNQVTGRPPKSFDSFAQKKKAAWM